MSNCDFSFRFGSALSPKMLIDDRIRVSEGCLMYFGNRPFEIAFNGINQMRFRSCWYLSYLSFCARKSTIWVPTRSDTVR